MKHGRELLALLADGRFHSGEALGEALGVSRANVWLSLKGLEPFGLSIEAVKGRGYRLSRPLELLDTETIIALLPQTTRALLSGMELFLTIESSNAYLMRRGSHGAMTGSVCLTEHQSAGRGRRGREWVSPLGRNLYLSILWRFVEGPMRLSRLSLAIAVVIIEALQQLGYAGLKIKWPNDIVSEEGKVGGILLEVAGESSGPCYAVIGIGLNIDMPADSMSTVNQPWANLPFADTRASRNEIAARLISQIFDVLDTFPATGLDAVMARWSQFDGLYGKEIDIHLYDSVVTGIARGVDASGALQVEHGDHMKSYTSGEVSVRLAGRG